MTSNFIKIAILISSAFLTGCSGYFINDASDEEAKLNKRISVNGDANQFIRYLKRMGYQNIKEVSKASPPICYGRKFNEFPAGTTWRNICFSITANNAVTNLKLYQYGAGL